jgi:hypothetical protein
MSHCVRPDHCFSECAMAFNATSGNCFVKISNRGIITRAIAPTVQRSKIGNGKLEHSVLVPIKIGLPFSSGTNHHPKCLSSKRETIDIGRLKKTAVCCLHDKFGEFVQLEPVCWRVEATLDKSFISRPRIPVVSCEDMRIVDVLMTISTGGRTSIRVWIILQKDHAF